MVGTQRPKSAPATVVEEVSVSSPVDASFVAVAVAAEAALEVVLATTAAAVEADGVSC